AFHQHAAEEWLGFVPRRQHVNHFAIVEPEARHARYDRIVAETLEKAIAEGSRGAQRPRRLFHPPLAEDNLRTRAPLADHLADHRRGVLEVTAHAYHRGAFRLVDRVGRRAHLPVVAIVEDR